MDTPCRQDPEMWFDPERFEQAIALCNTCPFKAQCAELGKTAEYGVWGGTTPHARGYEHEEDGRQDIGKVNTDT